MARPTMTRALARGLGEGMQVLWGGILGCFEQQTINNDRVIRTVAMGTHTQASEPFDLLGKIEREWDTDAFYIHPRLKRKKQNQSIIANAALLQQPSQTDAPLSFRLNLWSGFNSPPFILMANNWLAEANPCWFQISSHKGCIMMMQSNLKNQINTINIRP